MSSASRRYETDKNKSNSLSLAPQRSASATPASLTSPDAATPVPPPLNLIAFPCSAPLAPRSSPPSTILSVSSSPSLRQAPPQWSTERTMQSPLASSADQTARVHHRARGGSRIPITHLFLPRFPPPPLRFTPLASLSTSLNHLVLDGGSGQRRFPNNPVLNPTNLLPSACSPDCSAATATSGRVSSRQQRRKSCEDLAPVLPKDFSD